MNSVNMPSSEEQRGFGVSILQSPYWTSPGLKAAWTDKFFPTSLRFGKAKGCKSGWTGAIFDFVQTRP